MCKSCHRVEECLQQMGKCRLNNRMAGRITHLRQNYNMHRVHNSTHKGSKEMAAQDNYLCCTSVWGNLLSQ